MIKKTIKINVFGKVQGVWFRASTRNKALELGLCGIVKNLPDGSVYIEATGMPIQLESLLNWCHSGPPHARVENVESETIPMKTFDTFEVLR